MNYSLIKKYDIANAKGINTSIFFCGCTHHCQGCFNASIWDFKCGKLFDNDAKQLLIRYLSDDEVKGLSILGGEPLYKDTVGATIKLCKAFKEKYPDKNIWLWTGFTWETIENKEVLEYLDVLVDGQFKETLHDPRLKWCGSSNQRVIDVKKSLKEEKVVLYESEN